MLTGIQDPDSCARQQSVQATRSGAFGFLTMRASGAERSQQGFLGEVSLNSIGEYLASSRVGQGAACSPCFPNPANRSNSFDNARPGKIGRQPRCPGQADPLPLLRHSPPPRRPSHSRPSSPTRPSNCPLLSPPHSVHRPRCNLSRSLPATPARKHLSQPLLLLHRFRLSTHFLLLTPWAPISTPAPISRLPRPSPISTSSATPPHPRRTPYSWRRPPSPNDDPGAPTRRSERAWSGRGARSRGHGRPGACVGFAACDAEG